MHNVNKKRGMILNLTRKITCIIIGPKDLMDITMFKNLKHLSGRGVRTARTNW